MQEATDVVKWFKSSNLALAHLSAQQTEIDGKKSALFLPVKTRWQSNSDCLKSLLASKTALERTVMLPNINGSSAEARASATTIKEKIVSDRWWSDIKTVYTIVKPFTQVIIKLESNTPRLSSIWTSYSWLMAEAQKATQSGSAVMTTVYNIMVDRWNRKILTIPMILASVLDTCSTNEVRRLTSAELGLVLNWLHDFYNDDPEKANRLYVEITAFNMRCESYNSRVLTDWGLRKLYKGRSRHWWEAHYNDRETAPESYKLSQLAQDLLSIQPTSGASERNWSTFAFIHSKSRNRLLND